MNLTNNNTSLGIRIIFYTIAFSPLLLLAFAIYILLFFTTFPQDLYIRSVRNIYFDCLQFTGAPYVYNAKQGGCVLKNWEYDTILTHDSQGFRNKDSAEEKTVVLVGDSHTHGVGVNDNKTFSALLESSYGYSTTNLGIGSYATKRELESLKEYSKSERFVVIQYCDNDAGENAKSLSIDDATFREEVKKIWSDVTASYNRGKSEGIIRPIKDAAGILRNRSFISNQSISLVVSQRDINREAHNFSAVVGQYEQLLHGKHVVVFESSGWGRNHPQFKIAFEAELKRSLPHINIHVLDSATQLKRDHYYFLDDHLNTRGHAKVAELLSAAFNGL